MLALRLGIAVGHLQAREPAAPPHGHGLVAVVEHKLNGVVRHNVCLVQLLFDDGILALVPGRTHGTRPETQPSTCVDTIGSQKVDIYVWNSVKRVCQNPAMLQNII